MSDAQLRARYQQCMAAGIAQDWYDIVAVLRCHFNYDERRAVAFACSAYSKHKDVRIG